MTLPFVSAIMPACYGKIAAVAIRCFLDQTYDQKELVILDNNPDGETIDNLCKDSRIKYHRVLRENIGVMRNNGNDLAIGDVICNWDCDDFYSKERIAVQVERLSVSGKAVTGFHSLLFYNTANARAYRYKYAGHGPYGSGTTLAYRKDWWKSHPFDESLKRGEDYHFVAAAAAAVQMDSIEGIGLVVARSHRDSTCPPQFSCSSQYPEISRTELPKAFFRV